MGNVLKNWTPKEVIAFLKRHGFSVNYAQGKGDHAKLYNPATKAYTIVDTQHASFLPGKCLRS